MHVLLCGQNQKTNYLHKFGQLCLLLVKFGPMNIGTYQHALATY